MAWIRVGDLLVADDATTAGLVNNSASLTRAALDAFYDKTTFASQAEAQSGTSSGTSMSPLRTRQAFDQWLPGAFAAEADAQKANIARIELASGAGVVAGGNRSFFQALADPSLFVVTDPKGIITPLGSSSITTARSGYYRFSASMAIGGTADTWSDFTFGWAVAPRGREESWGWQGTARSVFEGGVSRVFSTFTWHFTAGTSVTPAYNCPDPKAIGTSNRNQNRVVVEYLGGV